MAASPDAEDHFPFPLGVSGFTTMPWSFEEDVRRYAEQGFAAIEVCEQKLDEQRLDEQLALVRAHGLSISAVQPLVRTFGGSRMQPEPKPPAARIARLRRSIERLGPLAPGAPFVVNTGAPAEGDVAGAIERTTRALRDLAPVARDHGVRLALEPLNPTSLNVESAIWTVGQALRILDAVGSDRVGLCLDLWNVWQQPALAAAIAGAGERIFALQVSDWRTPRSLADRLVPGDGDIPLGPLLRQTWAAGYRGACSVEIFSQDVADSLYDQDLGRVLERSRAGLRAAWSAAAGVAPA